jgi:hypothetical protein
VSNDRLGEQLGAFHRDHCGRDVQSRRQSAFQQTHHDCEIDAKPGHWPSNVPPKLSYRESLKSCADVVRFWTSLKRLDRFRLTRLTLRRKQFLRGVPCMNDRNRSQHLNHEPHAFVGRCISWWVQRIMSSCGRGQMTNKRRCLHY